MKYYIKQIDGKSVIKIKKEIVIVTNGLQIINPSEELLLENGGEEYVAPKISESEQLEIARESVLQQIKDYDESFEVNIFYIDEFALGLDKNTRTGLKLRFEAEMSQNKDVTTLGYDGMSFDLTIEQAIQMLYLIEIYASECYDNTQRHISNVKSITSIDELYAYDYTTGYPEKLRL